MGHNLIYSIREYVRKSVRKSDEMKVSTAFLYLEILMHYDIQ